MCLAIPGTIQSIDGATGVIDYGGATRRAELRLVPQARVGDRVIVHAGFAIAVLDEQTGDELMQAVAETKRYG